MKKIVTLEHLSKISSKHKNKGKKVVLCHGVFDLLHIGHIKHFKEAKSFGDILIVTLTADKFVNKGPNRPVFNENLRLEFIAALSAVDYVALNKSKTAINPINKIKPNIYCKGHDYKKNQDDLSGQIKHEINAVKKIKGEIIYTNSIIFSSSKLINQHVDLYPNSHKLLLKQIKKKYKFSQIKKLIDNFKKLKILVIGETIIDKYIFCEALGKSSKEPVLVMRDIKDEEYLGGAAAISRHLSEFCKKITLLSMVGEKGEFLNTIRQKLPSNITFKYIKKKNSPTILKKRFLDSVSNNKVFGVYSINDDNLDFKNEKLFNDLLKKNILSHDLVIVSDYGHGLISKKSSNIICKMSKYLALNAQVNAANVGYHSMLKYQQVDCVIINVTELRHELRDKKSEVESLMKKLANGRKINNLIVTKGKLGSIIYNRTSKKFSYCDGYAHKVVDKIGAGDAMLSMVSLCLKLNFDKKLALLIGSLAAAHSVETIGNKESVNKINLLKSLDHLLK